MILSLLGTSVYNTKSRYNNNTKFNLKEGEFINSIDALLYNFHNESFIFLGTEEAIKVHKENLEIPDKNVEFIEFNASELNDIFIKIMEVLIKNKEEKIIFDITHSFRDSVIMSIISTIVSQIVYKPNISMIYAKEIEKFKVYRYELVSEEILNTANIATILSTFLSTLKVPPLFSKYKLYDVLHDFSTHLVSNQFKDIYEKDIVNITNFIEEKEDELFFVKPLIENLKSMVEDIKNIEKENIFQQFIFFSELFVEKDYFLHSSTYLIEAITYYLGEVFIEIGYINFDVKEYANQQKIIALLRLNYNINDYNFPHEYFVDINIDVINRFNSLREKVANIRHNLAHINIEQDYKDIKKSLENAIAEFNELQSSKVLYKLDKTLDRKKETVKYKLEKYYEQTKQYNHLKINFTKLETIVKKYHDKALKDLSQYDSVKLSEFIIKNIVEIEKLLQYKRDRKLLLGTKKKVQDSDTSIKIMPNGEVRKVKNLKKPVLQTKEDKELLRDGAKQLSQLFNNR